MRAPVDRMVVALRRCFVWNISPMSTRDPRFARHWTLDPEIMFLNHGSFGACPRSVLEAQSRWRERVEREPVRFLARELEDELDCARAALAKVVGADPASLAFVPNATTGVNTILRSAGLSGGDEVVITDHAYKACKNAVEEVARAAGARIVEVGVPFPIESPEQVSRPVIAAFSARTRLLMIDHITSPTGLVFPIEPIVREAERRGIMTLVDGAHAPGMVPLDLERLGASFYTGNCHKWLCTPKGCALLWVSRDHLARVRPLVISHGASIERPDRSRFHLELDFTGTYDPSAYLSVTEAIRFLEALLPGGLPELMAKNREKTLRARDVLCRALDIAPPAPAEMIGAIAALPLPDGDGATPCNPYFSDVLQEQLFDAHKIEVPVYPWPAPPKRLLRIAAQIYNADSEFEKLASILPMIVPSARSSTTL